MYKIIIADDEKYARLNLKNLLLEYIDTPFEIVGYAKSLEETIIAINLFKPDIVFMDIEMNGQTPFNKIKAIERSDFDLIFVTAFEQYAVNAFDVNATDYLLKPISPERLIEVFKKTHQSRSLRLLEQSNIKINDILDYINYSKKDNQIILKEQNNQIVIDIKKIIVIEAMRSYSKVIFTTPEGVQCFTISKPLSEFEKKLPSANFVRIHRSFLVNIDHLKKISKSESISAFLTNEIEIPISRRKISAINDILKTKIE